MKYKLTVVSSWTFDYEEYYNNISSNENNMVNHETTDEYTTNSKDTFIKILKSEIDIPDYELTKENIINEFGTTTEKNITQIYNYYNYRQQMFNEIINWMETQDSDNGEFHFDVPYEYNHFYVCELETDLDSTLKQNKYSFTIKIQNY
jgi:hypothetical protein